MLLAAREQGADCRRRLRCWMLLFRDVGRVIGDKVGEEHRQIRAVFAFKQRDSAERRRRHQQGRRQAVYSRVEGEYSVCGRMVTAV